MPELEPELTRREFHKALATISTLIAGALGLPVAKRLYNPLERYQENTLLTHPNVVNILVLADFHFGNLTDDNILKLRLTPSQVEAAIRLLLANISNLPFDMLLVLGDLIQEGRDHFQNMEKFRKVLALLMQFPWLIAPTLGNHDCWGLDPEEIQQVVELLKFPYSFQGVIPLPQIDAQLIYLNTKARNGQTGEVTEESLALLERNLAKDIKTFIGMHYLPLPFKNSNGYPYPHLDAAYLNGELLMKMVRPYPIGGIFTGHTHMLNVDYYEHQENYRKRSIPIISFPSFSENLGSTQMGYVPGVYTILELHPEEYFIKVGQRGVLNPVLRIPN